MKRYIIGLLAGFLLIPGFLFAQGREVPEDLFILSSHTASSEWAQQMLYPVAQLRSTRPDLTVSLDHLQLLSHKSVAALQHTVDSILLSRRQAPRLVMLLGGSSFNFAEKVQKRWPGVPMLLVGEQDYYCDVDYTLNGPGDPNARRVFVSSLRPRGFNLSLIVAPPMIRRTLEMISQVQPNLKKLYFIAGENYMSTSQ